jgi:hypothetical protein
MVPRQSVLMSMQLSKYTNGILIMWSARGYLVLWRSSVECFQHFTPTSYFCALYYLPWMQESKFAGWSIFWYNCHLVYLPVYYECHHSCKITLYCMIVFLSVRMLRHKEVE